MRSCPIPSRLAVLVALALPVISTPTQEDYVNFEAPQVQPIAVAAVGSGTAARDFLLVCNTPDNSLEIYETQAPFRFVQRVPVGLSPVTVRFNPANNKAYTCNFVGDSVSVIRLEPGNSAGQPIRAKLERTDWVGDEPCDIVFTQNNSSCLISLNSKAGTSFRSLADLSVINPLVRLQVTEIPGVLDMAIKQPRQMAVDSSERLLALNFMGGAGNGIYDYGMHVSDPTAAAQWRVPGLGTTNHAFAMSADESRIYVVGTRAQNLGNFGVEAVSQLETGFVQSWLWVVDAPAGSQPAVRGEAAPGATLWPTEQSINLNRDYAHNTLTSVTPADALAQPTSVLAIERGTNLQKLFVTAYHSDKVAFLTPDGTAPGGWRTHSLPLPLLDPGGKYGMVGPRAAVHVPNRGTVTAQDQGTIFVANRLENSITVIDVATESLVASFALHRDPTPDTIRYGRQFLYGAKFSGSGSVSCASCHIDGRTDGLPWNLGAAVSEVEIPDYLHDGNGIDPLVNPMPVFPPDKGFMITQTLQGLVDHHAPDARTQLFMTNAPYHWRGDKDNFQEFNEAFVNLQGMPSVSGSISTTANNEPAGLSRADMNAYTAFINTIRHPPNSEQPMDRRVGGDIGDPDDPLSGNGALRGLKLFHTAPIASLQRRSCVGCHFLPEGSNNRLTLLESVSGGLVGTDQVHPFESAATRNLVQRELLVVDDFTLPPNLGVTMVANSGLLHDGSVFTFGLIVRSINDFVIRTFGGAMPGTPAEQLTGAESITEFMRTMDSGIAPIVGFAFTANPSTPTLSNALAQVMEIQVSEANADLVAYVRRGDTVSGYWFDMTAGTPGYRLEGTNSLVSRAVLLGMASSLQDQVVILQSVPSGSARRIAGGAGGATPLPGPAPSNVSLEPMAPSTYWQEVAKLTANWDPGHPTNPWIWGGSDPEPGSIRATREFQQALLPLNLGVDGLRHEPPRRFRVVGDDIRPGARLFLGMFVSDPSSTQPRIYELQFPIFPTGHRNAQGQQIWETYAELDGQLTLALLCGGLWAPGVTPMLRSVFPPPDSLDPAHWNRFMVAVVNEDGIASLPPVVQTLKIQHDR